MNYSVVVAGVLGLSLLLSVSVYAFARLRIEQEKTLQKLIDRGLSGDELLRATGVVDRGGKDLKRGLLFIAIGLSWSIVTFFAGGQAWIAGIFPVAIGSVYVLFKVLDGRRQ
jgi:hypothetical protein